MHLLHLWAKKGDHGRNFHGDMVSRKSDVNLQCSGNLIFVDVFLPRSIRAQFNDHWATFFDTNSMELPV